MTKIQHLIKNKIGFSSQTAKQGMHLTTEDDVIHINHSIDEIIQVELCSGKFFDYFKFECIHILITLCGMQKFTSIPLMAIAF